MNCKQKLDLRFFTRDFILSRGGDVDDSGQVMEAVLPEELAEELTVPEFLDLGFSAEGSETGKVHYGSHLLDKMVQAARERIPVTRAVLHFDYLKTAGFERLIQELFTLRNGVGKVGNTAEARADYIILYCDYLAQSDEQKEGLLTLVYNRDNSVEVPDMADGLAGVEMKFERNPAPVALSEKEISRLEQLAQKSGVIHLAEELKDFEKSMNRRFRRGVKNLNEYYQALREEMEKNLQRSGLSEQLISDRKEKIALIPAELAAKREDLFKKYTIRTQMKLGGAMLLKSPVVKVIFHIAVGKNKQTLFLIYNPVTKSIEPLPCHGCGRGTYKPFFGSKMEILCPDCG